MEEASLYLHLRMPGDLTKPERLGMVCKTGVYMSNLHQQNKGTFQWGGKCDPAVLVFHLLWLLHPCRRKHLATLCQSRLTHPSIITFGMILTFRLSRVYQHQSGADIYLLLLLLLSVQAVCSLRCADWLQRCETVKLKPLNLTATAATLQESH